MKDYLFIDSTGFVGCALLTDSDQESKQIKQLNRLIEEQNNLTLIVPEVQIRQINKVLLSKGEKIKKQLNEVKEIVGKKDMSSNHDKNEIMDFLKKLADNREQNIKNAKIYIKELLECSGCEVIPLNQDVLVRAYLRQVEELRPFNADKYSRNRTLPIDVDCVIVETLGQYFIEKREKDTLHFCTGDISDFFIKEENDSFKLHPEIQPLFSKIKTKEYKSILDVLEFFGLEQTEIDKQEFNSIIKPLKLRHFKIGSEESKKIQTLLDNVNISDHFTIEMKRNSNKELLDALKRQAAKYENMAEQMQTIAGRWSNVFEGLNSYDINDGGDSEENEEDE